MVVWHNIVNKSNHPSVYCGNYLILYSIWIQKQSFYKHLHPFEDPLFEVVTRSSVCWILPWILCLKLPMDPLSAEFLYGTSVWILLWILCLKSPMDPLSAIVWGSSGLKPREDPLDLQREIIYSLLNMVTYKLWPRIKLMNFSKIYYVWIYH
jgi:hypothetical protein